MASAIDLAALIQKCRPETDAFLISLHTSEDNEDWTSLLKTVEAKIKQTRWGVLQVLKSLILSIDTITALRGLMQVFIKKVSDIIIEHEVIKSESLATELLVLLKDFWALCSNQHYAVTRKVFGIYSVELYDILPSLASIYVDLFVASNRSKEKAEMLSKRLYGWLNFELNDRCLKTALLEVSDCTPTSAQFLLPLLRKVLLPAPPKKSFMDYLQHFVLLRRWTLVSKGLGDVIQANLNVKAPKNFVDWLMQRWTQASEHVPQDKSLKGRRVSELLCSLDEEAVEQLIDVFSQCLVEAEEGEEEAATPGVDEAMVPDLFVIDKTGSEQDQVPPKKKKRKLEEPGGVNDQQPAELSGRAGSPHKVAGSSTKTNGIDISANQKSKKVKALSNGNKDDQNEDADAALGFVLDRTASKKKRRGLEPVLEESEEHEEEEMEVDDDEDGEPEDAESDGDGEGNSEEEPEDDDGEEEEEDEDENESGEESDVKAKDISLKKSSPQNSEEELDDDDDDDVEEEDEDESESGEESDGEKSSDVKATDTSLKKPPPPTVFPSCEKDPALSYFVSKSPEKSNRGAREPEIEVIETVEVDPAEAVEPQVVSSDGSKTAVKTAPTDTLSSKNSDSKKTPKFSDVVSSSDRERVEKRKRKTPESKGGAQGEVTPSISARQSSTGDDKHSVRSSKRKRTVSEPTSGGKVVDVRPKVGGDTSPGETPRTRRMKRSSESSVGIALSTSQSLDKIPEENDVQKQQRKISPSKKALVNKSTVSEGEEKVVENDDGSERNAESLRSSPEKNKSVDGTTLKSAQRGKRLRSESETSQSRGTDGITSSERSHITRGAKRTSESSADPDQKPGATQQKVEGDKPKLESAKKRKDSGGEDGKSAAGTQGNQTVTEETSKDITMTEDQIVLALSQIRNSLNNSEPQQEKVARPSRSTRLRTKSESSDVAAENKEKSTRRRQTLTGIKSKEDATKTAKRGSVQNVLTDWLRKAPTKSEKAIVEKVSSFEEEGEAKSKAEAFSSPTLETVKADSGRSVIKPEKVQKTEEGGLDSSGDDDVTFNRKTVDKTYPGSAKRRGRSPKRVLIESKVKESNPESPRKKSPPKSIKAISASPKKEKKGGTSSSATEGTDSTTLGVGTTPKTVPDSSEREGAVRSAHKPVIPQAGKSTGPGSQRRKYYLRGTSPVKSPTGETAPPQTTVKAEPTPQSAPVATPAKKTPRKSPAERRKSLRSASKHH